MFYSVQAGIAASPKYSAVEKLKQIVDVMMRFHMAHDGLNIFQGDENFFSITFGQGLAVIRKASNAKIMHSPVVHDAPVIRNRIDEWEANARSTNP